MKVGTQTKQFMPSSEKEHAKPLVPGPFPSWPRQPPSWKIK
jgi:hypothetical protein